MVEVEVAVIGAAEIPVGVTGEVLTIGGVRTVEGVGLMVGDRDVMLDTLFVE